MAYESIFRAFGLWLAGADLSGAQFKFVVLDANQKVQVAGATVRAIGVLQNKPVAGRAANVAPLSAGNISKVVAGAAVAVGAEVASDASGRAIAAAGAGTYKLGVALSPAAAAGDIISVLIACDGVV